MSAICLNLDQSKILSSGNGLTLNRLSATKRPLNDLRDQTAQNLQYDRQFKLSEKEIFFSKIPHRHNCLDQVYIFSERPVLTTECTWTGFCRGKKPAHVQARPTPMRERHLHVHTKNRDRAPT